MLIKNSDRIVYISVYKISGMFSFLPEFLVFHRIFSFVFHFFIFLHYVQILTIRNIYKPTRVIIGTSNEFKEPDEWLQNTRDGHSGETGRQHSCGSVDGRDR